MKKTTLILGMFILMLSGCRKDDDSPEPVTITIDDLTITMDENPEQVTILDTISASTNRGVIIFSLSDQNPENAMTIDSITGILTVANAALFNYEVNPTLTAKVIAANENIIEEATVTVILNDVEELPITISIEDIDITINENPEQGVTLDTICARTNRGVMVFSLSNQNPEGAINIDPDTGILTVADNLLFDYEVNPTLTATVIATNEDVKEEAIVTVTLHDVDETPITITVEDFNTSIDENPEQGQSLGTMIASTNRGTLIFSLTNENPQGAIVIDENTGALTVADASLFDYEINPTLTATAVATNENVTEQATINITLVKRLMSWEQIGVDIDGKLGGDELGTSVSISADGSVVAIGASASNGYTGHVAVYRNQGGDWVQIGTDIIGEAAVDRSGASVSISADGFVVAIGANNNDGNGQTSGHVRVYRNEGDTWVKVGADIDGEARDNFFGESVSLNTDGSAVAIGAPTNSANGLYAGHVRVYQHLGGNWVQIGGDIDGETVNDFSGKSVSLSTDGFVVAIGAPRPNDVNGAAPGRVRIYRNQSGNWVKIGGNIIGEAAADRFGTSVSMSADGSVIAIGAPSTGTNKGYVKVYRNLGSSWSQVGLNISGETAGERSGQSVSLNTDGSVVAIGADAGSGYAGNVKVYQNQGGSWVQVGSKIDGEIAGDRSGRSISLSANGSVVAIGAKANDGNGGDAGHVRIFKYK